MLYDETALSQNWGDKVTRKACWFMLSKVVLSWELLSRVNEKYHHLA